MNSVLSSLPLCENADGRWQPALARRPRQQACPVRIAEPPPHKARTYCYDSWMPNRPVSVARSKTKKVEHDIRVAEAELHESNQLLADTVVGTAATAASVKAAVAQNVEVEEKLHDAVAELATVNALLKVAEAKNAGAEEDTSAGHRSGEGIKSVMDHLQGGARRREQGEEAVRAAVPPSGEATS